MDPQLARDEALARALAAAPTSPPKLRHRTPCTTPSATPSGREAAAGCDAQRQQQQQGQQGQQHAHAWQQQQQQQPPQTLAPDVHMNSGASAGHATMRASALADVGQAPQSGAASAPSPARMVALARAPSSRIFWFRPKGYPAWPVQVVNVRRAKEINNVDLAPVLAMRERLRATKKGGDRLNTLVQYFGSYEFDWVAADVLLPLADGLGGKLAYDQTKRGVPRALKEVWGLLERGEMGKLWWSHPRPDTPPSSPDEASKPKSTGKGKWHSVGAATAAAGGGASALVSKRHGLLPPVSETWLMAKPTTLKVKGSASGGEDSAGREARMPPSGGPFKVYCDYMCPTDVMELSEPKYSKLSRSTWVSAVKCKPVSKADVQVCMCAPAPGAGQHACLEECINRQTKTFCHPTLCPAGASCTNLPFHKLKSPPVKVFATEGRGWGVKAAAAIPQGTFVVEYIGELINEHDVEERLWEAKRTGEENFYMMQISVKHVIDARNRGNFARLLNSGCAPNCETERWTDPATGEQRVGIFTKRDIAEGEELTYDYCFQHFGADASATSFVCICGAPTCRGSLDAARALNKVDKGKGPRKARSKAKKRKAPAPPVAGGSGAAVAPKKMAGSDSSVPRVAKVEGGGAGASLAAVGGRAASGLFAGRPIRVTYLEGTFDGVVQSFHRTEGKLVACFPNGEVDKLLIADGGIEWTDRAHAPEEAAALARAATVGGAGAPQQRQSPFKVHVKADAPNGGPSVALFGR